MRRLWVALFFPAVFLGFSRLQPDPSALQTLTATPSPTLDPLVEPLLPLHPTELELGRNLYWHWCMPCHGERGQGLTDEFRGTWVPDHQNCWARGCHSGRAMDEGFPLPTSIPAIARGDGLARFSSLQELDDYLRRTHPPQRPGSLKSEEYHAIVLYVFAINGRSSAPVTPTAAMVATPAPQEPKPRQSNVPLVISAIILLALILGLFISRQDLQS